MAQDDFNSEFTRLNAIDSSYDRRREMEAMPADAAYETRLTIDKLERTYGYIREEGFRDGQTVIGTIPGTNQEVKISLLQSLNDEIEHWEEGDSVSVIVNFHDYDTAYNRYHLLGRSLGKNTDSPPTVETIDEPTEALSDDSNEIPSEERLEEPTNNPAEPLADRQASSTDLTASDSPTSTQETPESKSLETNQTSPEVTEESTAETTSEQVVEPEPESIPPEIPNTSNRLADQTLPQLTTVDEFDHLDVDESSLSLPPAAIASAGEDTTGKLKKRKSTKSKPKRQNTQSKTKRRIVRKVKKLPTGSLILVIILAAAAVILIPQLNFSQNDNQVKQRVEYQPQTLTIDPIYRQELAVRDPDLVSLGYTTSRPFWTDKDSWPDVPPLRIVSTKLVQGRAASLTFHPHDKAMVYFGLTSIAGLQLTDRNFLWESELGMVGFQAEFRFPEEIRNMAGTASFSSDGKQLLVFTNGDSKKLWIYNWPITEQSKAIFTADCNIDVDGLIFSPFTDSKAISLKQSHSVALHHLDIPDAKTNNSDTPVTTVLNDGTPLSTINPTFAGNDLLVNITDSQLSAVNLLNQEAYRSNPNAMQFRTQSSQPGFQFIITTHADKQIRVYHSDYRRPVWAISGFIEPPKYAQMASNGTHMAVIPDTQEPTILIINFRTGELTMRLLSKEKDAFQRCEFTPDLSYLTATTVDHKLIIWPVNPEWVTHAPTQPDVNDANTNLNATLQ